MLKVEKVSKRFLQGESVIHALKDVSFQVGKGETVAIVGPSGSGKTTLLSVLAGLEPPTAGRISLEDQVLADMNESKLSRFRGENIGIVFQQFHLMPHLTALENVCLPLEILDQDNVVTRAEQALQAVGLRERKNHLPHQLSGGECQRVAIARASVVEPNILLADEPSGNLDTKTGEKVMDILFSLVRNKQMTMVLVTHDTNLANRCDRKIHLEGGALV